VDGSWTLDSLSCGIPRVDRIAMLDGVAAGLSYLHDLNIVHNDVKGANILVEKDGTPRLVHYGRCSIIEQGLISDPTGSNEGFRGRLSFFAPERFVPERYGLTAWTACTPASDIYAFGMTILEVFSDLEPFSGVEWWNVFKGVPMGLRPDHPGKVAENNGMTPHIWAYIQRCWRSEPVTRPTVTEWNDAAHPA